MSAQAAVAVAPGVSARRGLSGSLLLLEMKRLRRNRRTLIFAVIMPALFFFLFTTGSRHAKFDQYGIVPYYMVGMATYATFNSLLFGGGAIAAERAVGWPRQLRIGGLSGLQYVATKVLVAYMSAVPGVILVLLVGNTLRHVEFSAGRWLAIAVSALLAALPVAALGVALGYLIRPQALQTVLGLGSTILAMIGTVFIPVSAFSTPILDVDKVLPPYWIAQAPRAAATGSWLGWEGLLILLAWAVAFSALAAWAYRRDSLRPGVVGAT